jgi:oligopeptide transport system ATP-binding protein
MEDETPQEGEKFHSDETPSRGDETPAGGHEAVKGDTPPAGTARPAVGTEPILDVRGLKVHYPIHGGILMRRVGEVKAVDGVDFLIREGETLGLVGESGCGKTTVGKAIINLVRPTEGTVVFSPPGAESVDLAPLKRREMRPYRAEIQMIFQDPYSSLNPRWTVGDIVGEPLLIHEKKLTKEKRHERVVAVLRKVGLTEEQSYRYPHEFSGGQRQRIGVARALATNPKLLICDEPVSALDVSIQAQVINLLQDLQEDLGLTYLFIAHDLSVVVHIANRIAVMYLGDIVEIGASEEVYHQPKHPYSKALLSAVPLPDPKRKGKMRVILKGDVPSPLAKPSGCGFRTRCPIAKESCAAQKPELVELSPGRFAACPYHDEDILPGA